MDTAAAELSPHSDLDLVLLHSTETPASYAALLAERLWYPIWDSGIRLDHSVRSVGVARQVARTDLPALLGMLDLRHIAGDPALTSELPAGCWPTGAPTPRSGCLRCWRPARSAPTAAASWPMRPLPTSRSPAAGCAILSVMQAVAASWVADCPHQGLAEARNALLDVRDALQSAGGPGGRSDPGPGPGPAGRRAGLGRPGRVAAPGVVASVGSSRTPADLTWYRVGRALVRLAARPWWSADPGRGCNAAPLADGIVEQDGEAVLAAVGRPGEPTRRWHSGSAAAAAQAGIPVVAGHRWCGWSRTPRRCPCRGRTTPGGR